MDALPNEADCARGLAMNDVKRALGMEAQERLTRPEKPARIPPRQPWMMVGGVGVMPTRAVSFFLEKAPRVTSRHELDFMTCGHEPFCERSRVILHPADAVARDRDDAYAHRLFSVVVPSGNACRPRRHWLKC